MSTKFAASELDLLASAVQASTGLVFPRTRRSLLHRAALEAMREFGTTDRDEFVRRACSDERHLSRLATLATVGETYLFRYGEQLDELRRVAIEPLVAERRRHARPSLRVWSAGCSTGEEAYTLAIVLAEAVGDVGRWDIRVVGTDLNADALARARRGAYGQWSMRGSWAEHARWLKPAADGLRVAAEIRRLVTFEQHNLATLPVLPVSLRDKAIDLIVCRNVVIYLDRSVIGRILDGFHGSLAAGGWLVMAPVEASIPGLRHRFDVWPSAAGTLYRRGAAAPAARLPVKRAPRTPAPAVTIPAAIPVRGAPRRPPAAEVLLAGTRSLADAGRLSEARDACVELLRRHPGSVDGHLLLASIAEAQDDVAGASDALRRTIYLDRQRASAHFRLGLLEWRGGRTKRAAARLQRALQLVEGHRDDEPLDDLHELTPARLRSVVGGLLV